jgi:hypothetical protein
MLLRQVLASLICGFTSIAGFSQHTAEFLIRSLPQPASSDGNLYIAGSFNNWNPHAENFRFGKDVNGTYFLTVKLPDGVYEFKITRGSWDNVECEKGGADIQNRFLKLSSDTTINLTIEEWADRFAKKRKISTAGKNVHIIGKHTERAWREEFPLFYLWLTNPTK